MNLCFYKLLVVLRYYWNLCVTSSSQYKVIFTHGQAALSFNADRPYDSTSTCLPGLS